MPARTAVLLGATGLVGGRLLSRLAADARWDRVVTLDRRPLDPASPTHRPVVVDFDLLDAHADRFAGDALFCCLGTTMKRAGSEAAFRRVDLEIPVEAARLARAAGVGRSGRSGPISSGFAAPRINSPTRSPSRVSSRSPVKSDGRSRCSVSKPTARRASSASPFVRL